MPDQELIERLEKTPIEEPDSEYLLIHRAHWRDAIAALKSVPDWHDAPTCAGDWFQVYNSGYVERESWTTEQVEEYAREGPTVVEWRFFGPIPPDTKAK